MTAHNQVDRIIERTDAITERELNNHSQNPMTEDFCSQCAGWGWHRPDCSHYTATKGNPMTKNTQGSEWEKRFDRSFCVVYEELPEKDYFPTEPSPSKIKQFIASERQALLQKVRELLRANMSHFDYEHERVAIRSCIDLITELEKEEL